ncbi:hypothetical protein SKAU_G00374010 [Synaphobranchus kaupii]|uniref:Uncharacterized protein n=1 Tax=Synaphobranchus kaupii TaxID=118154 RepID=A0A9Q1EGN6_SYNKA|nr:hypothetical protein SKAU_G00374010 [Synaphobranchus kaupii]
MPNSSNAWLSGRVHKGTSCLTFCRVRSINIQHGDGAQGAGTDPVVSKLCFRAEEVKLRQVLKCPLQQASIGEGRCCLTAQPHGTRVRRPCQRASSGHQVRQAAEPAPSRHRPGLQVRRDRNYPFNLLMYDN